MKSRVKELFQNTILFIVANMGSKILVFLMVPLYTAVLTTEEYGISDLVHTTSSILYYILTLKISDAVLRYCFLKDIYSLKSVFTVGLRVTVVGTLLSIIISICLMWIPLFESLGYYIFFIPFIILSHSFASLLHRFARGIGKVKVSAIGGVLNTFVAIILNLLFLLVFKLGIVGFLLSYILAEFSSFLYMSAKCSIKSFCERGYNSDLQKSMIKYSLPLVPNSLSWWALGSINRYIMLSILGVSVVGIYSATLRIPTILTVLADIFSQAWLLSALKNYGSEESKLFIKAMHNRFFSILVVLTSIIIILSKFITHILLSGEFSSYWYITPFLFISVFWGAMVSFLGTVFSAERKNSMQFISTLIGAIVSIAITLVYLRNKGGIVVAVATMIGYFVIWLFRRISVNKYLDIGVGTTKSILQGGILVVEAILISNGHLVFSFLCIMLVVILNYKELKSTSKNLLAETRNINIMNI